MIVPVLWANGNQPASEASSSSSFILSVPEDFDLNYSIKEYNKTGQLTYESDLGLSSNGSTHYAERHGSRGWPPDINASALLGQEFVDYLRDAMNNDGLCSLNGTYNDAGWHQYGFAKNIAELVIQTPCGSRTLKFYGDAMVGILPYTYVAVNKIAWRTWVPSIDILNVSVEVSAQLGADATLSMSAVLRNNALHDVDMAGCSKDIWPAKIVRSNGCSIALLDYDIASLCDVTVAPGDSYQFNPHVWNATGLAIGKYVVMAEPFSWGVTMFNITQDLGHINQAPHIFLLISEPSDSSESTYVIDASECCDGEDLVTDLQVRWDWYSDGIWDTNWSFEKTARYTFANMTGYNLTIEVKDSNGLVAVASYGMTVSHSTLFSPLNAFLLATFAVVVAVALLLFFRRKRKTEPDSVQQSFDR